MRDRTEHPAAEDELKSLFEASLDLLGVVGTDGYLKRINAAWVRTLGHSEQDLLRKPVLDFIHPDDQATTIAGFARAATGRTTVLLRVRGRCADGTYRLFEWNSVPRAGGALIDVVGRDITARVAMEQALRESEDRYHQVVEALHEGVVLQDASGAIITSNASARQILGLAVDEITGRTSGDPSWRAIHEDGSPFPEEDHPALVSLRTGQACTDLVMGLRHLSGETRWIAMNTQPLMRQAGDPPDAVVTSFIDITERTLAREALADREARLGFIVGQMPGMLWSIDTDLLCTSSLGAGLADLGLELNQIVGVHLYDFAGTSDPSDPAIVAHRHALSGTASNYDATFGGRSYAVHVGPLRAADGTIRGAIGMSFDVSEQVAARAALSAAEEERRRSMSLLTSILDGTDDHIHVKDRDGRYLLVNRADAARFGLSVAEIIGRTDADLIGPQRAAAVMRLDHAAIESGGPRSYEQEATRDGVTRTWFTSKDVIRDDTGRITGVFAISREITDQKRVEAQLRQMEGRYRGLLEAAPDAMAVVNEAGEIVLLNLQAERQFGYQCDELVGQQVTHIIPEGFANRLIADDLRSAADALAQQIGTGIELSGRRKDGTEFPIEIMLSPLESAEGILVTAAIRDISVRKAAEAQLRQSQKMEAVGQLTGGIAHDFNNLLTAIRGYGELVRGALPASDETTRADVGEIIAAADRAAKLTRQLLAFSRRQVLQPQIVDPAAVVAGIVPLLRRLIGEHIDIVTAAEPGAGQVRVDPSQLEQVIVNLAVNARDAMPDGGRLTLETMAGELDAEDAWSHPEMPAGRYVMLMASDTGIGMDTETQAHIFEPFFTTKALGQGTGLGLATVYGIVKQSGGWIYVDSDPGCGTTFKIYLPHVAEEATAVEHPTAEAAPPLTGSGTVLLVEDEPAVRALAARLLAGLGYSVLLAANGAEALDLAASQEGPIDLLLTDVVMRGMQGSELAARLTAARPSTRVLYVSGFADGQSAAAEISAGAAFLPKPYTVAGLGDAVRQALNRSA